jgi:hypothetical protein
MSRRKVGLSTVGDVSSCLGAFLIEGIAADFRTPAAFAAIASA